MTKIGGLISLSIALSVTSTAAQPAQSDREARPDLDTAYSIRWDNLPLGTAVKRLEEVAGASVLLDRRVDPDERIDLTVKDATVEQIIERLATENSLGACRVGELYYVGPERVASRLAALMAQRRSDVAALPAERRAALLMRRRIVWPRLTQPRALIEQLVGEHGWQCVNCERVPHDLWAAGELPKMPLADQLTLLLAGFDLTFRVAPEQRAIEIVGVDWEQIEPTAHTANSGRRQPPRIGSKQVFTLRVERQAVGRILEQLGRQLDWQLEVDEAAIRTAGRSLDQQVSFEVKNADEDRLLEVLLAPAGLQAKRDGNRVRVVPRD